MGRDLLSDLEEDYANYTFAAIRGIQAGREYYVAMCPLRQMPRIFLYDEDESPPEYRAQRTLNKARIPEITNYILENPNDYAFSSITVSVDGRAKFEPTTESGFGSRVGRLVIPSSARLVVNDGQHRRAAIVEALKQNPELGHETLSVVFFLDAGLKRSQQMFADLNQHAVRPTKSLSILYDHRSSLARLSLTIAEQVPYFKGFTEYEKTTLSNRSTKLFTLSSIYQATKSLLGKRSSSGKVASDEGQLAVDFWNEVGSHIPEWRLLLRHEVSAAALRKDFVHSHGVILHALGLVGHALIEEHPRNWKEKLKVLEQIDWRRGNARMWEGRAMIGGRLSKAYNNVVLTAALLKRHLKLGLSVEEERLERGLMKARE